jgi:hypothetical protein
MRQSPSSVPATIACAGVVLAIFVAGCGATSHGPSAGERSFSIPLKGPRPGTYEFTVSGSRGEGPSETQTVVADGTGWTIKTDRGGNGGDSKVEMRTDGLYLTAQVEVLSNGERRPCRIPTPQLSLPNPIQAGRQWTSRFSCPSGVIHHDSVDVAARSQVQGMQTIRIGGRSVEVVRIEVNTVDTTGSVVSHTHALQYIDPDLGIIVEQITDISGIYTEHLAVTLALLPAR